MNFTEHDNFCTRYRCSKGKYTKNTTHCFYSKSSHSLPQLQKLKKCTSTKVFGIKNDEIFRKFSCAEILKGVNKYYLLTNPACGWGRMAAVVGCPPSSEGAVAGRQGAGRGLWGVLPSAGATGGEGALDLHNQKGHHRHHHHHHFTNTFM